MISIEEYMKYAGWNMLTQEEYREQIVEELANPSLRLYIKNDWLFNENYWIEYTIKGLSNEN